MDKKEVLHIIEQGEDECAEFKTSFGKEVIESIVAFSNSKGGKVIIGVNDSKKIVGVDITEESIQNWVNQNKLIAKAFKEVGLIERYGSGIRRISNICRNYGIVPPVFEEIFDGFRVTLLKQKENVVGNVVGKRLEKIVSLVKQNKQITATQVAKLLGVSERTAQRYFEKLKKQKRVKRIGSDKSGHWEVIK